MESILIHILFLDNYKKYMEPWDLSAWIAVPGLILTDHSRLLCMRICAPADKSRTEDHLNLEM